MVQDDEEIPDRLKNLPFPSDEGHWQFIEDRFNTLKDVNFSIKLETKEQAVHQRHGVTTVDKGIYWYDPDTNATVRPWLQIPYDPSPDEQHFQGIWQMAKAEAYRDILIAELAGGKYFNPNTNPIVEDAVNHWLDARRC